MPSRRKDLFQEHHPEAIEEHLRRRGPAGGVLADAVLGAIDGCVTTFVVVAGTVGAGLPTGVAVVLGAANLIADGFSMAASNYEAAKTRQQTLERVRTQEGRHIDMVPEGEREEVRQIFAAKGFHGDLLERVVNTIAADRARWIDTMLMEEHGLAPLRVAAWQSALATFVAFVAVGVVPLLPFLGFDLTTQIGFLSSVVLAGSMFLSIGYVKSVINEAPRLSNAIGTLLTGGAAAGLAWLTGWQLQRVIGIF